jgi:hypothetical protein
VSASGVLGAKRSGDGDADSDIDLLVVRPSLVDEEDERWRMQMVRLAEDVHSWTGNHAGLIEVAVQDLPGLLAARPPVLGSLRTEAIPLAGLPPARLWPDREPA